MKEDDEFLHDLKESEIARRVVARWIERNFGGAAIIRPVVIRPNASVRAVYGDDGDIEYRGRIIEVKRRALRFKDALTFPYSTMIIDEKHKAFRHRPLPLHAYAILNAKMTHMAIVRASTSGEWVSAKRYDPSQGRECEFYEIAPSKAMYYEL